MSGRRRIARSCKRSSLRESGLLSRVAEVEILEARRLLAIDLAQTIANYHPAEHLLANNVHPHSEPIYPNGPAQPYGSPAPVGFVPAQIRHAYGFDQVFFGGVTPGDGTGQTIAIIDAYDAPTIANDLHQFDLQFGIPDPPSFTKVSQTGSTTVFPPTDPAGPGGNNWEVETALDVEWIHALAPNANILLVEAQSNSFANLIQTAVNYARNQPQVSVISMSFGGIEFASESVLDTYFTTPAGHIPITFIASTGDTGAPGGYPSFSPNVVAVGGTTLTLNGSNNITGETGWSGSGGGISQYEPQPAYQAGIVTQSSTFRTIPDISFDANPSSGVAIYDSYNNSAGSPWTKIGGTSFSAPSWAALTAIANQGRVLNSLSTLDGKGGTLPALYSLPSSSLRDITSGNNGFAAGVGYDLVTGRGSPLVNSVVTGLLGSTSISGTVFSDTNGNGVFNSNEGGLEGFVVYDDLNNNGVLDPPTQTNFPSTDTPISLPATTTKTSTLNVSGFNGTINDVNVTINIQHTKVSDLVLTLIAPDGTQVTLANHNGVNGANFTNTVFDDQAASSITSIVTGNAPFTASYRPAGALSSLLKKNPNGAWKLQVVDNVSGNSGTLQNWSLQLISSTEPTVSTTPAGGFVFTNVAMGMHHIRQVAQPGFDPVGSTVYDLNVVAGTNLTGQNFGNISSTASGQLYSDDNGNGSKDPGEIGLSGATYDDLNNNGVPDTTSTWTTNSTDVPKSITDMATFMSSLAVSELDGTITDVNVNVTLHHPLDSNLALVLVAPDGTQVTLASHNGNSANFLNTTFDDSAGTAIASGSSPFAGSFRPTSVLSALNGKYPNGLWKLLVADTVTGNTGTLDNWSLQITTNHAEPLLGTDGNGNYTYRDLNVGTHHLRQFPIAGYSPSGPPTGVYNFTLATRTDLTGFDFANHAASIAGTVFNDADLDGTLDNGETGLAGWTVYDDLNNDGVFQSATDTTLTPTDTPQAIPDLSTISSTVTASGLTGALSKVRVSLTIHHPSDTDLQITLISPAGTAVPLFSNSGTGSDFLGTTFDDDAPNWIDTASAPYSGTYRPNQSLGQMDGEDLNGTWTLQISDILQLFSGTLDSWSLELITDAEPNVTTAADGSYLMTNVPDGTHTIRELVQPGYTQTGPPGGTYSVDVTDGVSISGKNFGNTVQLSGTPGTPDLLAVSDLGISSTDDVTKLNNGTAGTQLSFQVSGTVVGATVGLYADGNLIGSAVASDTTTTVTTDGITLLGEGNHAFTARQTVPGKLQSLSSAALTVKVDSLAPSASITPVSPTLQTSPVSQMTITFNEVVSGLTLANLSLTRDGGGNLLTGAQTLGTSDGLTWTLGNLGSLTGPAGAYTLALVAPILNVTDVAGNVVGNLPSSGFTMDQNAPLVDLNGAAAGTGFTSTWSQAPVRIADTGNAIVSDADGTFLAFVSATLATVHAGDMLAADPTGTSINVNFDGTTLTLSGSASASDYQQVLRTITYHNTLSGPGAGPVTINVAANDGQRTSNVAVATVLVNTAPVVDLDGGSAGNNFATTWTNAGAVNIATGTALITDDGTTLASLTATIAAASAGDVLSAVAPGGSGITVDAFSGGTLFMHGTSSLANYLTLLKTLKYENTSGGPGVGSVTVNVVASDGSLNSNTAVATVSINLPPALDLDGGTAGNDFSTNWSKSGPVNIESATASITDNSGTLASLTVTISAAHAGDVLSATAVGNITVDGFAGTTLFIHGVDSVANYVAVLQSIKYNNTLGSPLVPSVSINLVANDGSLNSNTAVATVSIVNSTIPAGGRKLFYNSSGTASPLRYDGNNAAINANDDNAIATNKSPYLPGTGTATFANVSSYSKGINGLMLDLSGPHAATLTAADFVFKVGGVGTAANVNTPSTSWTTFTETSTISVRPGAGVGGSDRVEIVWDQSVAPRKTWLEVIVLANANTGLVQAPGYPAGQGDVFFWGSAPGDTGDGDTTNALTSSTDEIGARNHPAALGTNIPITNVYDFNHDGQVNSTDGIIARNNGNANATAPRFINIASPPAAPQEDGGESGASPASLSDNSSKSGDNAVVSALATDITRPAGSAVSQPAWIANRLHHVDASAIASGPASLLYSARALAALEHALGSEQAGSSDDALVDDNLLDELLAV